MLPAQFEQTIKKLPAWQWLGETASGLLHVKILQSSEQTRKIVDFLHGTWLKHPLHPLLTDITLGAWIFGSFFDCISFVTKSKHAARAADTLNAAGIVSSIPTALSGLADYSAIPRNAVKEGTIHGVINVVSLAFFGLSFSARLKNKRGRGVLFSSLGLALATFSAWMGGELVSRLRVGVNHTKPISTKESWVAVLPDSELTEHEARRVDVNGEPIVLYRYGKRIFAFAAACSHNAGPLDKGIYNRYQVQCPWHDSVFDVRDGCVIHGPATHDQPTVQVRIQNGQIEVCA